MAIKLQLEGYIYSASVPQKVGAAKLDKQTIVLQIPSFEAKGKKVAEEHWEIVILGAAVEKFNIRTESIGEKAIVTFWIKSSRYLKADKSFYNTSATLSDIRWITSDGKTL